MMTTTYSARNTMVADLPIGRISPSALNPRKVFDEAALDELAESIRTHGLIEPLVVRPLPLGEDLYSLIAGERRWRAARIAGLVVVPAVVMHDVDDTTALQLMLVENLQRQDLDPIEEAEAYRRLNKECGLTQSRIAESVKKSQPVVANRMRLLELPDDVRRLIRDGKLSTAHGIALCRYSDFPAVVNKLAEMAIANQWTSRVIETGIPDAWELQREGIIQYTNYHFLNGCSDKCEHNAYRNPYHCLNPSCWEAKKAAYEAEAKRVQDDALEHVKKTTGEDLVKQSSLRYGTYEELPSQLRRPAGCAADCPKIAKVLGYGEKIAQICTDPKHYKALRTAETKAANRSRNKAHEERGKTLAEVFAEVDELGEQEIRILGMAVGAWLYSDYRADAYNTLQSCLKRRLPDANLGMGAWSGWRHRFNELLVMKALPAKQFALAMVEAFLEHEVKLAKLEAGDEVPIVDWYLGLEEKGE